jgi:hypothetical protein
MGTLLVSPEPVTSLTAGKQAVAIAPTPRFEELGEDMQCYVATF